MLKFKYFHTIRWKLRSGQDDDPYEKKVEQIKIINNKSQLQETPDASYHVRIENFYEIYKEEYSEIPKLEENQFYVDYETGMITFHPSQEGKTLNAEYMGRGIVQYPADRIWVHSPNPYAVDNLQELIDAMHLKTEEFIKWCNDKIKEFTDHLKSEYDRFEKFVEGKIAYADEKVKDFTKFVSQKCSEFKEYIDSYIKKADKKISEIDNHIGLAEIATREARAATESAKTATENAEFATENAESATYEAKNLIDIMREKIKECIEAIKNAVKETELTHIDRLNTRLIWQEPVDTYVDILQVYNKPEIGWTVQTKLDGKCYRWNGAEWKYISNLTGAIPEVTSEHSGLMRAKDYVKLNGIEEKAQRNLEGEDAKNVLPEYFKTKTMVFYLGEKPKEGLQPILLQFPCNGKIEDISAFCRLAGDDPTSLYLEKIDKYSFENNLENWDLVTDTNYPILFNYGKKRAEITSIINNRVREGDYFRLRIASLSKNIKNITVEVTIKI